ncbi:hypothetical protein BGZ65_008931 [Modicella reniformis]|uniref:Uncharacterized protein n=1 Tax=Modicella reniformis TaxID=1440133 RepID=A0A9P6IJR4_9FUNG|nr:hypothetical protein BGZ65_008931 [Modicella reniformis]
MHGGTEGKKNHSYDIRLPSLNEIHNHISRLRHMDFKPCSYNEKGYILCGSIKTDGFRLQLLAFKIRELHSVKFKRYKDLPDPLLTTTGGTNYYLTEQKAVLQPTFKHRRWMGTQKSAAKMDPVEQDVQPTSNSSQATVETQKLSISDIETALPPLHGENANFAAHMKHCNTYKDALDTFYNGDNYLFKRHKWNAKRAKEEEYHRMTDSLLKMVGGSIGVRRKEEDKVIIGIGLGKLSSSNNSKDCYPDAEQA